MTGGNALHKRWSAHPWRARGVRLLVYVLPIALSLAFVHLATSLASPPTSSLAVFLVWWLLISAGATVVVMVVYSLSRRLLPLGVLLELSLVFPDEAPSRFQLALSTGTVESLEERVRLMQAAKAAPTTQEAAEILLRLAGALSIHDHITRGHAERVRAYSYMLGTQLGLPDEDLDRLNWAALLHDIGKLEVSSEILNKPGKPSDEEWASLQRHPRYGETLVEPLRQWLGEWIEAVGHHHERWDGTGYPRGLAGAEIPRAGRIVAIADALDVITSARSYKAPASTADARAEIVRCSGTHFDPSMVRAFVEISLGKMRLVMGPLSWLAHAPLLARIPFTPSIGAAFGGLAAVATATAAVVAGPTPSTQAAVLRDDVTGRPAVSGPGVRTPGTSVRVPGGRLPPTETREPGVGPGSQPAPATPTQTPDTRPPAPGHPGAPGSGDPTAPAPGGGTDPPAAPAPEVPGEPSPSPSPEPGAPGDTDPPKSPPAPPAPQPPTPEPPPPNQPPSFTAGGSQSVLEDAGGQSVSGWASAISPGPSSEASQTVAFAVSTDNPGLFSGQPAVGPDGTLTYAAAADASGVATVTVTAVDNGGTANGGVDASASAGFTITVTPVNDAPSFSGGGNQTAVSLLGAQSISGWATGIAAGPANESSQSVSFVVTVSNPGLFTVQPAVSSDGTLTYTPKLLGLGVATVTVRAVDSAGTANGGTDTSPPQAFTITII